MGKMADYYELFLFLSALCAAVRRFCIRFSIFVYYSAAARRMMATNFENRDYCVVFLEFSIVRRFALSCTPLSVYDSALKGEYNTGQYR